MMKRDTSQPQEREVVPERDKGGDEEDMGGAAEGDVDVFEKGKEDNVERQW